MQIGEERQQGAVIVVPRGRIDSNTSAGLDEHLLGLVTAGERRLVLDFAAVEYISSAGLRVMLALAKRMREVKGALAVCGMGEPVRLVFDLAGFLPLFVVEGTRAAALERVTGG